MESDTSSDIGYDFQFNSSLQACAHLMPEWICRVREDYKEEDCESRYGPLRLLEGKSRVAVWTVTRGLNVRTGGVAALACRLMERYLCAQLLHRNIASAVTAELARFLRGLTSRVPILTAICVQIAAKSISATLSLTAKQVCTFLNRNGIKHSIKDVISWEHHVFQTIGYRVPLWTSVEMAELLATQTLSALPARALPGLAALVELAELRRDALDERVRWAADLSPDSGHGSPGRGAMCVRTLHLAAGAVAAAARCFVRASSPRPLARRLAAASGAPAAYVECVRDAILGLAVGSPARRSRDAKRRRLVGPHRPLR